MIIHILIITCTFIQKDIYIFSPDNLVYPYQGMYHSLTYHLLLTPFVKVYSTSS